MAQRLIIDTKILSDMTKTLSVMYSKNMLYDYANYVTIWSNGECVAMEMCIILDGASNDAMIRLLTPIKGVGFAPLVVNFEEFNTVIGSVRAKQMELVVEDKHIQILAEGMSHVMQLSTTIIPQSIVDTLQSFSKETFVDFNLLKLYNNMNEIADNLTLNTLQASLFGIMNTPTMLCSTNGFSIGITQDYQLNANFLFPKHSLRMFKQLPKIGAKYAIKDHRICIKGDGFVLYIGEWSGYDKYPVAGIAKYLDEKMWVEVEQGEQVMEAVRQCTKFGEIVETYIGLGYATNKDNIHKETFVPTPVFGDHRFLFHTSVLPRFVGVTRLLASKEKQVARIDFENRVHIFMGMKEVNYV